MSQQKVAFGRKQPCEHQVVPAAGQNLPQEQPLVFARAVLRLVRGD